MQTHNLAEDKFKKLQELFPNAVTEVINENGEIEKAIDKDVLMQEISSKVVEGREERYQFTWPDKKQSILVANAPISKTLRPCRKESKNFDTTENLYIEGDNLEVLKLLQETYLGKIKMIYIDPPYNTGNDFVYNDDFKQTTGEYLEDSGQFDEEGNRLDKNLESNGRFHTDWLNMIYPRLKLARNLLSDDGVIFISIDENEVSNLRKICDEIFGESNFISEIVWSGGRKNDSKYISNSHEYIVCYFKNINYIKENKIVWREKKQGIEEISSQYNELKKKYGSDYEKMSKELKKWYSSLPYNHPSKDHSHYNKIDKNGIYFGDNISWPGGGGPDYEVLHPVTKKPVKVPSRGWITNKNTLRQWINEGRVDFGKDEKRVPTLKSYLADRLYAVPYSVIYKDGRAASKRIVSLMEGKVFQNPKDEDIISRLIKFCGTECEDIILDFFSGSATTAHAVMQLNAEDGGNRKFIMVQLPEQTDEKSEAYKAGYKNICEIGKERIRRSGEKILEENKEKENIDKLDVGFRVLKIDSSNMKDVYYSPENTEQSFLDSLEDNIKEDRTQEDLLFQVMLDLGVPLSSNIEVEQIEDAKVFKVEDRFLVACFDGAISDEVVRQIADMKPFYAVFRDMSMKNDSVAVNFEQIFESVSPETIRKVL